MIKKNEDLGLLTMQDAADYLSVSKISLRRWTKTGRLRCFRVGVRGERRFSKADLNEFLSTEHAARGESVAGDPTVVGDLQPIAPVPRPVSRNHVSLHFSNQDEQFAMLRPYLLRHVRLGAPMLYIYDSTSPERLMDLIRSVGVDPDELTRRGLLRAVPSSDVYLLGGGFSTAGTLAFLENYVCEMLSGGRSTALVTGEMSWYFSGANGVENILDYERQVNRIAKKHPQVTIICQYSIERFDSAITLGTLCAHPVAELPERTVQAFYDSQN
jgi:excisionase family DNA binding protein